MDKTPSLLPGYEKTKELITLYRQAGFTNEEISRELLTIEKLIFAELVGEIEERMSEEEKKRFDDFLKVPREPEEIAQFLKINKEEISLKIESRLQELISDFKNALASKSLE